MRVMRLEKDFYEVAHASNSRKYWTVSTMDDDSPFIMSADGNQIKPDGQTGKKVLKALSDWLAERNNK